MGQGRWWVREHLPVVSRSIPGRKEERLKERGIKKEEKPDLGSEKCGEVCQ